MKDRRQGDTSWSRSKRSKKSHRGGYHVVEIIEFLRHMSKEKIRAKNLQIQKIESSVAEKK